MAKQETLNEIPPDLLTIAEFSRRLSVSVWTARSWAYTGRIATVRLGGRLQVPTGEVARLVHEGMQPRGGPAKCSDARRLKRAREATRG